MVLGHVPVNLHSQGLPLNIQEEILQPLFVFSTCYLHVNNIRQSNAACSHSSLLTEPKFILKEQLRMLNSFCLMGVLEAIWGIIGLLKNMVFIEWEINVGLNLFKKQNTDSADMQILKMCCPGWSIIWWVLSLSWSA